MKSSEIRTEFLRFFEKKGHIIKPPSSLVPQDDPTLLFTGAGMNQFKKEFLGVGDKKLKRVTTCQKCFRTSDIEIIGKSPLHHTFFEMLGNFSFGDYFKEEAIQWAWQFVTETFKLSEESIWISVYEDDEEAYRIWSKEIGVKKERIVPLGKNTNWWDAGETGPCGPCSEIIIDRGKAFGCGKKSCDINCDCGRHLELWNLVFTQFNRKADGSLEPLPQKNIDTGMGLERASAIMQKMEDNFLTDVFSPLVQSICEKSKTKYNKENVRPIRIISDHIRAIVFLISDGVFPSNDGKGYVLRRLIRNAARQGEKIKLKLPFLYEFIPTVIKTTAEAYPDLKDRKEHVAKVLKSEEDSYKRTLREGSKILGEIFQKHKEKKQKGISGKELFKLYDTYGLPSDLVEEIAREEGFEVDKKGFQKEMDSQKIKGRLAWTGDTKTSDKATLYEHLSEKFGSTKFVGYEKLQCDTEILSIVQDSIDYKGKIGNAEVGLIVATTPFYAEMGGQVFDMGSFQTKKAKGSIDNVYYGKEGLIVHSAKIEEGEIEKGEKIHLTVNKQRRQNIACHHTATHLLQYALRTVLGSHIQQSGSLVEENYLRFDFSHFSQITKEELARIEEIVNEKIREIIPVKIENLSLVEAKKKGALSFFGEKYGELVRVVSVGDTSKEFCGGIHVNNTGQIGMFHILSESSIGKGLRRIEAVAGQPAYVSIRNKLHSVEKISYLLKTSPEIIEKRVQELLDQQKLLSKQIEVLSEQTLLEKINNASDKAKTINGISVVNLRIDGVRADALRRAVDILKDKIKNSAVVVFGSVKDKNVIFVGGITTDLVEKGFNAGTIISEISKIAGGSGGGRTEMATGGGKDISKLDKALQEVENIIKKFKV
ncbi:MAG: alanine--tRNA ligase [Candidatus Omnitrophica bacterium]|nr:alanine--tRNA ligase [Candidatus Omnitrophota bacterium]MBU1631084.1 alanine--tRNA ligase [Candidatus Omnitrophota bacterium]MBU1889351.1 alanine--tRNA ligase [Candidatus Omnitrophota bacterium]